MVADERKLAEKMESKSTKTTGPGRGFPKTGKRGRETQPDPMARRITPVADPELLKKLEVDRRRRQKRTESAIEGLYPSSSYAAHFSLVYISTKFDFYVFSFFLKV